MFVVTCEHCTDSPLDVLCTTQCATNLCGVSAGAAQLYTSLPLSRAEFLYIFTWYFRIIWFGIYMWICFIHRWTLLDQMTKFCYIHPASPPSIQPCIWRADPCLAAGLGLALYRADVWLEDERICHICEVKLKPGPSTNGDKKILNWACL